MRNRTYAGKPLGDTEWLLEQWGWWRMDGMGVPHYVSPMHAVMCDNVEMKGGIKSYNVTDDVALAVDGAVARLTKRDQQMGDFVWLYFGAKLSMTQVGRKHGMSEGKARKLIKAGVAWVDASLDASTRSP